MQNLIKKFPTKEKLNSDKYSLESVYEEARDTRNFNYFQQGAGQEHYRLLNYIVNTINIGNYVVDLGTHQGLSALSMSVNEDTQVYTYDPSDLNLSQKIAERKNIEFKKQKAQDDIEFIAKADFIFLDIDPHNGDQELEIIKQLDKAGYSGMIVCDDINLNVHMKRMWEALEYDKKDISNIGHYTGSGLILLNC